MNPQPVLQLRLLLEVDDFDEALAFYRDALGLTEQVAFEVTDVRRSAEGLVDAGATLVATPRVTPWRSLNARVDGPEGLHLTLFQELESIEDRAARDGFATTATRADPAPAGSAGAED